MPFFEALSLSSIGKIAATIWANGSRFLWSVAVACALVAGVLRAAAYFQIHDAQLWWDTYGLTLMIAAVAVGVFAVFKLWAEWQNTKVFLIANERESLWHHAKRQDGSIVTQFAFRFHVTNTNKHAIFLTKVRVLRPSVDRRRVLSSHLATQSTVGDDYSAEYPIPARSRPACTAGVMVIGAVGGEGRKKPMQVTIGVQDNRGRWYKLVFPDLRDPQFSRYS